MRHIPVPGRVPRRPPPSGRPRRRAHSPPARWPWPLRPRCGTQPNNNVNYKAGVHKSGGGQEDTSMRYVPHFFVKILLRKRTYDTRTEY